MVRRDRERRLGRSRVVRRGDLGQGLRPLLGRDPLVVLPDKDGERPSHVARGRRLHGPEWQQHRVLDDRLRGHVVQHGRVDLAPSEFFFFFWCFFGGLHADGVRGLFSCNGVRAHTTAVA